MHRGALLPCDPSAGIRLLSWNVHGLPFRSATPQRLRRIAEIIREQQPDIALLQEVWLGRYRRVLARVLAPDYLFAYAPRRLSRRPRGGLLVLIRRDSGWRTPAQHSFTTFRTRAPWYRLNEMDGVSGKGVLTMLLRNDRHAFVLTTTHLQAQYPGRAYREERRAQLDELAHALGAPGTNPHIIAGDFNTAADEDLYTSHVGLLGTDLTIAERNQARCGTYFDEHGVHSKWIDYVLGRNLDGPITVARIENDAADRPFSDHDGLLVRWLFAQRAPS